MSEITKKDIYLKARLISEGVHIRTHKEGLPPDLGGMLDRNESFNLSEFEIPEKVNVNDIDSIMELMLKYPVYSSPNTDLGTSLILDGSRMWVPIYPNKHSRLEYSLENGIGTIYEGNEVLITGKLRKRPEWLDKKLSNGLPIEAALPAASHQVINVVLSLSCMNYNTKRGCRYCNFFANPVSKQISMLPKETLKDWAQYQAEAVKIATDGGWRGVLALSGGALAPAQRGEYLERIEIVINALREKIDDEVLSKVPLVYNFYAPEDFSDMKKWKELGIKATSIDLEVMDPAYFAAICPAKAAYKPHEYWKKAQEAAVEVFGPLFGSTGCIVMGIEPMSTLVNGIDERLSKGVMPNMLVFFSTLGSAYWGFRPPTADWIIEASNKIVDSFLKHGPKWLAKARRFAKSEGHKSSEFKVDRDGRMSIVFDELARRISEIGS